LERVRQITGMYLSYYIIWTFNGFEIMCANVRVCTCDICAMV